MKACGQILVWMLWAVGLAAQERDVPATMVHGVGGFAGGRIEKNEDNFLKKFPIGDYVGMVEKRDFTAWDWRQGEQPGKWLESAILTSVRTHDEALSKEAHEMYARVLRSQAADGYVGITSPTVRTPEKPLRGMDAYELYFMQHALLTAYEVWKDPAGLKAARRLGDYFVDHIGPGKAEFWPSAVHYPENKGKVLKGTQHSDIAGHSIHYGWEGTLLIDPMMRLYQLTKDHRYLDWCKWVVSNIDKWSGWDAYSNLDKVAAGEMPVNAIQPYVHTHTFQMNFLGLLRMFRATGDSSYFKKVEGVWKDVASRQLYITGGVSVGEHYERDHVKPLTGEMMETCATMSWMQLSQCLLDLTGDPKYADAVEKILWNQVFAEQSIDGDANRYFTPPNGYVPRGYFRQADCCMGSGGRLLSLVPGWIYATAGEWDRDRGGQKAGGQQGAIYINQYISSSVRVGKVGVRMETSYPEEGRVTIHVEGEGEFPLYVRIPAWCSGAEVMVNGVLEGGGRDGSSSGQYVRLIRKWKKGDVITLDLPMKLRWVQHDHYMKTSDRKPYKTVADADAPYALVRGPVVYALDDIWYKGDTADFSKGWMDTARYILDDPSGMRVLPAPDKDMLGPGYAVRVELPGGKRVETPLYPFANIGKWYRDPAHRPDSNAATWGYAIWLKGRTAAGGASEGTTEGSAEGPVNRVGVLRVPMIFGDNMVLQRNAAVPVWGMSEPGSEVTVQFGGQEKKARTDERGHWRVMLDALAASKEPGTMVIATGRDTMKFRNVLVGEVWLCGGQSNMEYSMRKNSKFEKAMRGSGPANELERADNPLIRVFLVGHNYSKASKDVRRGWDSAMGAPLREFSAAGYFFAKEIYAQLGVPVGVISTAIPGSAIEPFLPRGGGGKFYRTMIRPLAPYAVKGFLWYQGETNCFMNDTVEYAGKMKELIGSWRLLWEGPELPFYFVQIAPFLYSHSNGGNQVHAPTTEAAFWEEQERALAIPHTGMVVTTDLVDSLTELHPPYKWVIGHRLALLALGKDYGKAVEWSGPVYRSMQVKGHSLEISFSHGGLVSQDGKPLDWFEVAGKDGRFVPARAVIRGDKVIVSGVKEPVAVRFGWNERAQPNLYNKAGVPAMPFRVAKNGE